MGEKTSVELARRGAYQLLLDNIEKLALAGMAALCGFLFYSVIQTREKVAKLIGTDDKVESLQHQVVQLQQKDTEDRAQWRLLNEHSQRMNEIDVRVRVNSLLLSREPLEAPADWGVATPPVPIIDPDPIESFPPLPDPDDLPKPEPDPPTDHQVVDEPLPKPEPVMSPPPRRTGKGLLDEVRDLKTREGHDEFRMRQMHIQRQIPAEEKW